MKTTASNGSRQPVGPQTKPSNASNSGIPAPLWSPSSISTTHADVRLPPCGRDRVGGRHERWEQTYDARLAYARRAQRQADTRRRWVGHAASIGFLLVALAMAAAALHREQQLAPQEQRALESLR